MGDKIELAHIPQGNRPEPRWSAGWQFPLLVTLVIALTFPITVLNPAGASLSSGCESSGYSCVLDGYNETTMNDNWATNYYGAAATGGIGNPPHNCTLYAAWMLARSGLPDPKRTWGNAAQWGHTLASQTNSIPTVGSIAWYDAGRSGVGSSGHVAYVASVDQSNGTVLLVSDNYMGGSKGYTSNGWVSSSSPSGYIHFSGVNDSIGNLAINGGFEAGSGPWTPIGTVNVVDYSSGQVSGESPRDGQHYEATNTSQSGGGFYQDVNISTVPGETICGSAWVRTQYPQTGATGSFVLWLLGGSYNDSGTASFSNLGNQGNWTQVHTCVESTIAHTTLRIQFYPSPGTPTLDVDDVDVHESLAINGGFEAGSGPWTPIGTVNVVDYSSGQVSGESPRDGQHYEATNTSQSGGGFYQDVNISTVPGETICGSAWVRTQYPQTGATGSFVLWLLGGSYNDSGTASFSNLGNQGNWTQVHTCVESTIAHTTLRIQFYPSPGTPTLDVDDVDVHESLAINGGFEAGSGPWTPIGTVNVVDYSSGQVSGESPRDGQHYEATNTSQSGGGFYQDVNISTVPGETICGSAWVRTQYPQTGATGSFVLWLLGGSYNDSGTASFSNLGNQGNWTQVHTCVESTIAHTTLRIQFYPSPGTPTLDVDDVDVH